MKIRVLVSLLVVLGHLTSCESHEREGMVFRGRYATLVISETKRIQRAEQTTEQTIRFRAQLNGEDVVARPSGDGDMTLQVDSDVLPIDASILRGRIPDRAVARIVAWAETQAIIVELPDLLSAHLLDEPVEAAGVRSLANMLASMGTVDVAVDVPSARMNASGKMMITDLGMMRLRAALHRPNATTSSGGQ